MNRLYPEVQPLSHLALEWCIGSCLLFFMILACDTSAQERGTRVIAWEYVRAGANALGRFDRWAASYLPEMSSGRVSAGPVSGNFEGGPLVRNYLRSALERAAENAEAVERYALNRAYEAANGNSGDHDGIAPEPDEDSPQVIRLPPVNIEPDEDNPQVIRLPPVNIEVDTCDDPKYEKFGCHEPEHVAPAHGNPKPAIVNIKPAHGNPKPAIVNIKPAHGNPGLRMAQDETGY